MRGQSPSMIKFFKSYMTDTTKYKHPPFSELTEKCLVLSNPNDVKDGCLLSQFYKEGEFYLFHWTANNKNIYYPTINVNLGNDENAQFEVSYIDWFRQDITVLNQVTGTNFVYTAPTIPYNLQLIKIN